MLTPAAAQAALAAVRPADYARSRNHLQGAVTGLSPFITHGLLRLDEVLATLQQQHGLPATHKLVAELGWRAFFRHVWQHRGEGIFSSLHAGPLPDAAYRRTLPRDLADGHTGVPVIDRAVHTLATTGLLHNHARLWLASYAVHVRKLHWRVGADWLYAQLLDGDLASNHLSWQWVAGTGSHKPYLFNADNVARFAPPAWHSPGTVIDTGYEALGARALDAAAADPAGPADRGDPGGHGAHAKPAGAGDDGGPVQGLDNPAADLAALGFRTADAQALAGCDVWVAHPWSLADAPAGRRVVALCEAGFHRRWPWHPRRWQAVGARLQALTPEPACRWCDEAPALQAALATARSVAGWWDPHLGGTPASWRLQAPPAAFTEPGRACASFSAWWSRVRPLAWTPT